MSERCLARVVGRANLLPKVNRPEKQILLVDPDEAFGQVLQEVLGPAYLLRRVSTVEAGIAQFDSRDFDAILLNLDLRQENTNKETSNTLLRSAGERADAPPVVAYSWNARRETAVAAMQNGAVDFLEQPLDVQALKFALDGACRRAALARDLAAARQFLPSAHVEGLLGNSAAMDEVNDVIRKVAGVQTSVLITGESGTGKGVVARA